MCVTKQTTNEFLLLKQIWVQRYDFPCKRSFSKVSISLPKETNGIFLAVSHKFRTFAARF